MKLSTPQFPSFETEVCANSVESAIEAQAGGATRVELCMAIPEGGTTPSYGEIKQARQVLHTTRLHVIIRNRAGNFLYSPLEIERMAEDILLCKQLGVNGVVFGCLTPDGDIDIEANQQLLQAAKGMKTTFHRAFDACRDAHQALETLIQLGFDYVLTSGQEATAEVGINTLASLHKQAQGRIKIMAGCGVSEQNIAKIAQQTGINCFHFSARVPLLSNMRYKNERVYMGSKDADENYILRTSQEKVKQTIAQLALLNK